MKSEEGNLHPIMAKAVEATSWGQSATRPAAPQHRRIDGAHPALQSRTASVRRRQHDSCSYTVCSAVAGERSATVVEDNLPWDAETAGPTPAQQAEMDREARELAGSFDGSLVGSTALDQEFGSGLPEVSEESDGEDAAARKGRRKRGDKRSGKPTDNSIPLQCLPKVTGRSKHAGLLFHNVGCQCIAEGFIQTELSPIYRYMFCCLLHNNSCNLRCFISIMASWLSL